MNHKFLADTGEKIPEIGLGTWNYSGGTEPLREGIRLGATLIDTAEGYHTEEIVGESIRNTDEKVFIATKVSGRNLSHDDVLRSAEKSLIKLGRDLIDLYQIHWPNQTYPISGTMKAFEKLLDRGIIRFAGVSNFDVQEMQEAQHFLTNHKIVSNQVLYNLNARGIESELLPYCKDNNITILAYTPLDSGRLCRTSGITLSKKYKVLKEISKETGKTPAQVALNWCLRHANVMVIPKSDTVSRTVENCNSSGWYLDKDQLERLNNAFS